MPRTTCHAGGLQHGHWVRRFPRDRQRCAGPDGRAQTEQDFREAPRLVARAHHGRDFTLRGLIDELADRGLKVDYRSVREFVHAENLSLKKALSPANASVLTPPAGARNGRNIRVTSIPSVCSLSTRPGPRPTWQPCGGGRRAAPGSQPSARPLEDHDLPSRVAPQSDRYAMGSRWSVRGRELHNIYAEKVLLPTLEPMTFFCRIFARPESCRASLRQAQAPAPQSCGATC